MRDRRLTVGRALAHTQNVLRPGFIELACGEPDPRLLPVATVRRAACAAVDAFGAAAIAYGSPEGPYDLRAALAARIATRESVPLAPNDVAITGGISQALEQALTVFARPGDVVLVESPTYNLALATIRDHPVDIVGVRHDDRGLDVDELESTIAALRAGGRCVRALYTVPTFHNPTGVCLSADRRAALVALARREGLLILEDDVYREIVYEGGTPPSLWAVDPEAPVLRMGTFSKSLTPGLRVGWLTGRDDLRRRFSAAGAIESGGCPSQFGAAVAAALMRGGGDYDDHIGTLRATYSARRDALAAALREHLPAGCRFTVPAGGFFVWLRLPDGLTATRLLAEAERCRVSFIPGSRFSTTGDDDCVRLAFCLYDEEELSEGARRLATAVRAATDDDRRRTSR